jgi:hypothetical protein
MNKSKLKLKNKSKLKNKYKLKKNNKIKTKHTKIKSKNHRISKSKMVGGALPMKVISYNISWGSMSGNQADTTAAFLAGHCNTAQRTVGDETVCLTNVRKFLEAEYNESQQSKIPIGFIALQEAMNWQNIICRSDGLSNVGYVHHKVKFNTPGGEEKHADLCTLYNQHLFKLLGVSWSNINKQQQDGRPFHKLFFETITEPIEKFIFINFHNRHSSTIPVLRQELNDADTDVVYDVHETSEIHFENMDEYHSDAKLLTNFIQDNGFSENSHIIMAGDTNDHGVSRYFEGIEPFTRPDVLANIRVDTKGTQPPNTCCVGQNGLRTVPPQDIFYGDYIMISQNLNFVRNNYIPNLNKNANTNPTSDHLPVAAIIR